MTEYLLSIDPGKSSGCALLAYTERDPAQLVKAWQFGGGVSGLKSWIKKHYFGPTWGWLVEDRTYFPVQVIAEKFTARNTQGFSYTTDSLEALRGEGALIMSDIMPDYDKTEKRWRDPNHQYIFGGQGKDRKKQMQHRWLKENGFYVTGKMFGTSDADDARSAIAHGISYIVKELHHKPTFDLVSRMALREVE